MGSYAVKKELFNKRTLISNPEDFYVKYSLDEFNLTKKLDLKEGFEERPDDNIFESDGSLDELLEWILKNKQKFLLENERLLNGKLRRLNTDFVAFRGVFTLLLNISYDFGTPFILHIEKFKGTHYIILEKVGHLFRSLSLKMIRIILLFFKFISGEGRRNEY